MWLANIHHIYLHLVHWGLHREEGQQPLPHTEDQNPKTIGKSNVESFLLLDIGGGGGHLEHSGGVIRAGRYGGRGDIGRRGETENIIDLVRAEIVVGVLAVDVMVVGVATTDQ